MQRSIEQRSKGFQVSSRQHAYAAGALAEEAAPHVRAPAQSTHDTQRSSPDVNDPRGRRVLRRRSPRRPNDVQRDGVAALARGFASLLLGPHFALQNAFGVWAGVTSTLGSVRPKWWRRQANALHSLPIHSLPITISHAITAS